METPPLPRHRPQRRASVFFPDYLGINKQVLKYHKLDRMPIEFNR